MSNYYEKYLKYKNKYIELKNQYGSAAEAKREVHDCPICQERIRDNECTLHCTHIFHRECLLAAYNSEYRHVTCGLCRAPYTLEDRTCIGISIVDPKADPNYIDPIVAARAREDAADLRLIQLANREPKYFGYVQAIRNYGNIMNALNRYNAITLSLEADNNDDEAVSMTLDLDAPVDPRYREQDEAFSAIYELLKHNSELANHIDPETGRHILSFVVNSRMGQLLINRDANRNHIDIHARMPLSYVENIELRRELMRFNRPRPSRVNNQKVSNSVRK